LTDKESIVSGVRQIFSDGVIVGAATGVGTGLISWFFPLFRSKHLAARIAVLEAQAEKDRLFRQTVIDSQDKQMIILEALYLRGGFACTDSPSIDSKKDAEIQSRVSRAIEAFHKTMTNYTKEIT
jgi:hypothetical protein